MTCSIENTHDFYYNFIRFYITCGLILMFLRKYLRPTIFNISKEKYLFMGGRPMSECSMVNWLFDIVVESFGSFSRQPVVFGCLQFVNSFVQTWYRCIDCTHMSLLLLERCTSGLISAGYLHFCSLGFLGGLPSVFMFLL